MRRVSVVVLSHVLIWSVCLHGTGAAGTPQAVTSHPAVDFAPAVSSDGRVLVFVSDRAGNRDIWMRSLAASSIAFPKRITTHPAIDVQPSISGDGSRLLYVSYKNDPRGDVFLRHLNSGEEEQLTGGSSADAWPQWGPEEKTILYLKRDAAGGAQRIVQRFPDAESETVLVGGATSFSVSSDGWVAYSDGRSIRLFHVDAPSVVTAITTGNAMNLWPAVSPDGVNVYFARYAGDTNRDGFVDADDESSIWLYQFDHATRTVVARYRMTPDGNFHLHTAVRRGEVFFSDLRDGDILRVATDAFLEDYATLSSARAFADRSLAGNWDSHARLILGNMSRNLTASLSPDARAAIDFEYVDLLTSARQYEHALRVLDAHRASGAGQRALATIYAESVQVYRQAGSLGPSARRHLVQQSVQRILSIGRDHRSDDVLYGTALIEAGRLHLFAGNAVLALELLVKADALRDAHVRARALFRRAEVYRVLGDQPGLVAVYADVVRTFGDDSAWGRRAIAGAVDAAQSHRSLDEDIDALRMLAARYADVEHLAAAAMFRISTLYVDQDRPVNAVDALNDVIARYAHDARLLETGYRKKAEILTAMDQAEQAKAAYTEVLALAEVNGASDDALRAIERRLVLADVRHAIRVRDRGEPRIAAKMLNRRLRTHPDVIEAHRGYIETKVMLGEVKDVQAWYRRLVEQDGARVAYLYGHGLAQTYAASPDFPAIIANLERVAEMDEGISYVYQTLGWAYEQYDRLGDGTSGFLEKAVDAYRVALQLNDEAWHPDVEANLLLNLGNAYVGLGNFSEARRYYQRREQFDYSDRDVRTELLYRKRYGEAAFKLRDTDAAITQYHLALDLAKQNHKTNGDDMVPEILERLALAYQEAGQHARAVQFFSESLAFARAHGTAKDVGLLQRNIGVNLYNLSIDQRDVVDRDALGRALEHYFSSLNAVESEGEKQQATRRGLLAFDIGPGTGRSGAATGFDWHGEKKLLFSYIASAYEVLEEPSQAMAYHLKKLAMLPDDVSVQRDVAVATEKAVLLNRLGVLSHRLGALPEALGYMRDAFEYTRQLNLVFGTRVNAANIARLAWDMVRAGHAIDLPLIQALVSAMDVELSSASSDLHAAFALARVAFLLYAMPESPQVPLGHSVEKISRAHHAWYQAKSRVYPYYLAAHRIVETATDLPAPDQTAYLITLKLNLIHLADEAGKSATARSLRKGLDALVKAQGHAQRWLVALMQAEHGTDSEQRHMLLRQAFQAALSIPPQLAHRGASSNRRLFYALLSKRYADSLVARGDIHGAFTATERLAMRTITTQLYDVLGEQFFLEGIGSYREELGAVLEAMRTARDIGRSERFWELVGQFEALMTALDGEHPWAVSFFYEYPLDDDLIGTVVTPERPYVKLVDGQQGRHVFIHDGRTLRYAEVPQDAPALPDALARSLSSAVGFYLSGDDEHGLFATHPFAEMAVTRVNTIYDLVNAWHRRGLFYRTVAVAGASIMPETVAAETDRVTLLPLSGKAGDDRLLFERADAFIAGDDVSTHAFAVGEEHGARTWVHLADIPTGQRHSAVLLRMTDRRGDTVAPLVSGLIRQGFPHVLVNQTPGETAAARDVASLYFRLLDDLPSDEALAVARSEVYPGRSPAEGLALYGYAGMDEGERTAFARAVYDAQSRIAVSSYRDGNVERTLRGCERALSVIHHADAMHDFVPLTKLAVESAFQLKRYDVAVFHQERLVAHVERVGTRDDLSDAVYELGVLHSRREHYDAAVTQLTTAIEMWERTGARDRLAEGTSTRGVVRENQGDYEGALSDFGMSSRLFGELGEIGRMADQYRKIGRIHYLRLSRYEQARKHFHSALERYRAIGDRHGEAETLLDVGLTFERVGLFDRADEHYRAARRIAEDLIDAVLVATSELYLGNTAWFQGKYHDALQQLSLAYEVAQDSDDRQLPIMIENTKGLIFWTLNETEKGLRHLRRALEMAKHEDIPTEIASSLNNLGLVYRQQGDFTASLGFFEQAQRIDERLNNRWGLGYDHRNIGIVKLHLEQYQDAEHHLLLAEEYSAAIKNVVNQVKTLLELGRVNRAMRNNEKAASFYARAYQLATTYRVQEVQWRAAEGTAALQRDRGLHEDAVQWYARAVTIVEAMRAEIKIDSLRNSYQVNKQDLYRDTITLLVELGRTEDAFNYLERSRSRSFIDLLGNQKLALKTPHDEQRIERLAALQYRLETMSAEIASFETPPDSLVRRYDETRHVYDETLLDLQQRNPELSSFIMVDPLTQDAFERLLDPGVGVLSYMLGKDVVFIWLVQNHGTAFFRLDDKEHSTANLVERYRAMVQDLEPVDAILGRLYDRLVAPVDDHLTGVTYLGIIPDGALHFLSFAALKHADGFLVDRFPLFYAPSASVMKYTFAKRDATRSTDVLALGNPDLGNYNYDLPLAELEVESMRWSFPGAELRVGNEAKRGWLVENIARYGVIHLAAHGEFNDFLPLHSSILLSAPSLDEGRLSVKDVFSLNLTADIVTLSACQTGLGKLHGGEIIGLNRAFLYAGAHALISSLWRVDDLSTSVLMKHFYRNYASVDKATSLQRAQLAVKASFPHPSYWAGLSLVGDYQ